MTHLTVRQHKFLYTQQELKHLISKHTNISFKIRRKGKRCFIVTFDSHIDNLLINKISSKLGLDISYISPVRCILSDDYNWFY